MQNLLVYLNTSIWETKISTDVNWKENVSFLLVRGRKITILSDMGYIAMNSLSESILYVNLEGT